MRVLVCGGEGFEDRDEFRAALDSTNRVFLVDFLAYPPGPAGLWAGEWARERDAPAMELTPDAPGRMLDAAMPGALVVFPGGGDFAGLIAEARRREIVHDGFRLDQFREREGARRLYGLVSGETLLVGEDGALGVFVEILGCRNGGLPSVRALRLMPNGVRVSRHFHANWSRADAAGRPIAFPPEAERRLEELRGAEARGRLEAVPL